MSLTLEQRALLKDLQGTMSVTEISRSTGIARTTIREFYEREARSINDVLNQDMVVIPDELPADCGSSQDYLGIRPPTCLGGKGCRTCWGIYSVARGNVSKIPLTIFDNPIRPLAVEIPPPVFNPPSSSDSTTTALLYGDSQFPFQDDGVLSIVRQISIDLQPETLIHIGDLVDCYTISDYDRDPHRKFNFQDEINMARQHLAVMRLANPNAQFHLMEGNHEDRLRRLMWRMRDTAAELLHLDVIQRELTWPRLLGLNELGISFHKYNGQQAKTPLLPKFSVIHGNIVRKFSGYTARGEMEKYGRSGASGHTHRLGVHFHQNLTGNYVWVETGCTCVLDAEYAQNPDWQQGCVVMTFDKTTGAPSAEPVYIHNNLGVWRGKAYRA